MQEEDAEPGGHLLRLLS